jgi:hypothetical protein
MLVLEGHAVKPSLPSAPLTNEDCEIMMRPSPLGDWWGWPLQARLIKGNFESDRRDAELMLTQMINSCIVALDEPAEPPNIGRRVILHVMKGAVWPAQEVHGLEYP